MYVKIACMKVTWTRKADTSFNGIVYHLFVILNIEITTNIVDEVEHTI